MNESSKGEPAPGQVVVSADGVVIGRVESNAGTHLGVRLNDPAGGTGHIWLPAEMVDSVEEDTVRLNVNRADIHEAVLGMPPARQREFGTLGLHVKLGRARGMVADR